MEDLRRFRRFLLVDFFLLPRCLSLGRTGCIGMKSVILSSSEDKSESLEEEDELLLLLLLDEEGLDEEEELEEEDEELDEEDDDELLLLLESLLLVPLSESLLSISNSISPRSKTCFLRCCFLPFRVKSLSLAAAFDVFFLVIFWTDFFGNFLEIFLVDCFLAFFFVLTECLWIIMAVGTGGGNSSSLLSSTASDLLVLIFFSLLRVLAGSATTAAVSKDEYFCWITEEDKDNFLLAFGFTVPWRKLGSNDADIFTILRPCIM
mmetsp:Transcript_18047/g.39003  ORF Transcript_18047/g.39003 Transcript_18047/m.39003 type:complete len:263 (+) Transcript_18047:911-1699(+)